MTTPDRRQRLQGLKDTFACQTAMRFALIAFLNDESRDSSKIVSCSGACRRKAFVDEKSAPAAGGWGASWAAGAGLDFGVTPDQDSAILRIWVG